jgi:TRAP-type C4-dicarboxylate transport system permease small subunit
VKKILNGVLWFFNHFEELIASALMFIVFAFFGISIISRWIGFSLSMFQEIIQYGFLIALLFGISYANKHNEHIRADIITSRVSPKVKYVLAIIGDICTIAFSLGLVYYGMINTISMIRFPQNIPILRIPRWIIVIMLPVSSIFSIIRVIQYRAGRIMADGKEKR